MSSIFIGALLASDSGENIVADAAVRAPCRIRRSPCRNLFTRLDLEGVACTAAVAVLPCFGAAFLFPPLFLLDCFPMFEGWLLKAD